MSEFLSVLLLQMQPLEWSACNGTLCVPVIWEFLHQILILYLQVFKYVTRHSCACVGRCFHALNTKYILQIILKNFLNIYDHFLGCNKMSILHLTQMLCSYEMLCKLHSSFGTKIWFILWKATLFLSCISPRPFLLLSMSGLDKFHNTCAACLIPDLIILFG